MASNPERLRGLFETGALLRPDAAAANTVDLARTLHAVAGAPAFRNHGAAARIRELIGEPRHLVFVLADGLGMHLLGRLDEGSFLRRHLRMELQAVFPSSTGPALTSLATGVWPAEHAVPTWFTYLPARAVTGIMLPYRVRGTETDLASAGLPADAAFPLTVAARFFQRDFRAFQPNHISLSVFTRYTTGGRPAEGYRRLKDGLDAVSARIREAPGPTYTYFYWPDVDVREHDHGATAREAMKEVLLLDSELSRLKEALGDSTRIVVSADHGQVTVPEHLKSALSDGDELQEVLRVWPPAGEPRMVSFHVQEGRRSAFAEMFGLRFNEDFVLLSTDEAESLRLFGPGILSPEARGRIGDFVAIPTGNQALGYAGEASIVRMKGFHGGLSPDEMRVPLVVA